MSTDAHTFLEPLPVLLVRIFVPSSGSSYRTDAHYPASGAVQEIMIDFGFGLEVGVLTISLFVAGYCVGPLFWVRLSSSLSEMSLLIFNSRVLFLNK